MAIDARPGEQRTGTIDALDENARRGVIRDRREEGLTWRFEAAGVLGQGFEVLHAGDAVQFTLREGPDGLVAADVSRIIATNEPPLATPAPEAGPPPDLEDAPG